ncbi:MAG: C10 family peptidase, partial [Bacteroidales bacterium]
WFEGYEKQIEIARETKDLEEHPEWKSNTITPKSTSVEPIIGVSWDQDQGWNQFCPEDDSGPGGRAYAGCVAVAMAQAMSVYSHPNVGYGSQTYNSPYGPLTANFGETEYAWDLTHPTTANEHAALILYHLGISVSMNYGGDGSGAYSSAVPSAMRTYFDYSNSTTMVTKEDYSEEEWVEVLRNELENGRPIYYSGNGGSGEAGHAFNVDGVDGNDRFHFNWGWSGSYDGYYALTNLTPGSNDFTSGQQAVINIAPRNHEPTNITLSSTSVDEGKPAGTTVATISVTDETPDDTHTFEVRGQENIFGVEIEVPLAIDGNKLVTTEELDYDDKNFYNAIITTTDSQNNSFEKTFRIDVNEVTNETSVNNETLENFEITQSNNTISIKYSGNYSGKYMLYLSDLSGRIVQSEQSSKKFGTEFKRININNITQGIYILTLQLKDSSISRKIYIN